MAKITEAHIRANKKWDAKNRGRKKYINARSAAKNFILKMANDEDLNNIDGYVDKRRKMLKK